MDTMAKDLEELKIRFNTAPKMYEKPDFQHLIHTIEHIYSLKCFNETSKAIANIRKKGKIKFTPDGFAIADKAIGQNVALYGGERIWLNVPIDQEKEIKITTTQSADDIKTYNLSKLLDTAFPDQDLQNHIIMVTHKKNDLGYKVIDFGVFNNVFTYRLNTKYINGKRQKVIIEKELPKLDRHPDDNLTENTILPEVFKLAGFWKNFSYGNGIIPGVRFYIRCAKKSCKKINGTLIAKSGKSKYRIQRMKYYRYGYKRPMLESIFPNQHWGACKDDDLGSDNRALISTLFNWIRNAHVGNKGVSPEEECKCNRNLNAYTYDMIVDKYIKNNITYRYKFKIYYQGGYLMLR